MELMSFAPVKAAKQDREVAYPQHKGPLRSILAYERNDISPKTFKIDRVAQHGKHAPALAGQRRSLRPEAYSLHREGLRVLIQLVIYGSHQR